MLAIGMDNLNGFVESDFELDEAVPTLGRHTPLPPNRTNITQAQARAVSYKAVLHRVQYGTYKSQRACLFTFKFFFNFKPNTRERIVSAEIAIRFRRASDDSSTPTQDDDEVGPHIVQLRPSLFHGVAKVANEVKGWKTDLSVGVQVPGIGPTIAIQPGYQKSIAAEREVRMTISGRTTSSTGDDLDDTALWTLVENTVQRDGILPRFQAAVVLCWPSTTDRVTANVSIEPEVAFSPLEAFRLRQRRNDPLAFDGKTAKGDPVDAGKDFADEAFTWSKVIADPVEYQNAMFLD